jgi:cobalt-zinc-cadmium efflux system membrane fusion protein
MASHRSRLLKIGAFGAGFLVLAGITAAAWPHVAQVKQWSVKDWWGKSKKETSVPDAEPSASLVPGQPDSLLIPHEVIKKLGLTTAPAQAATRPRVLELSGTLALDTDELSTIHSPFPGEIVEIADVQGASASPSLEKTIPRKIGYGDRVIKGQLLAVVWNTDLGNKKNDLIDALSDARVKADAFEDQKRVYEKGSASDAAMRQAKRDLEAALNRVAAAERTLRTLRVPEDEIDSVKQEAKRIAQRNGQRDAEKEKNWARVEIRAKGDGVVLERNFALGDIVDSSRDLFRIANLDRLKVWAHVFEEDVPSLKALPLDQRRWQIRLQAEPGAAPLTGSFDTIGYIIDPNQHTAPVIGKVDNPEGRLHAGYFVTCRIELPPPADEVVVPASAVVEDGKDSIVFVQPEPAKPVFAQRQVVVARRGRTDFCIRSRLTAQEEKSNLAPLRPGEKVVTSGAIELKAALEDLKGTEKK